MSLSWFVWKIADLATVRDVNITRAETRVFACNRRLFPGGVWHVVSQVSASHGCKILTLRSVLQVTDHDHVCESVTSDCYLWSLLLCVTWCDIHTITYFMLSVAPWTSTFQSLSLQYRALVTLSCSWVVKMLFILRMMSLSVSLFVSSFSTCTHDSDSDRSRSFSHFVFITVVILLIPNGTAVWCNSHNYSVSFVVPLSQPSVSLEWLVNADGQCCHIGSCVTSYSSNNGDNNSMCYS